MYVTDYNSRKCRAAEAWGLFSKKVNLVDCWMSCSHQELGASIAVFGGDSRIRAVDEGKN
jgi:hypothetical protein